MLTLTLAIVSFTLIALIGRKADAAGTDWQASYQYAHRFAVKYRHQRDHLQEMLASRTRQVRHLQRHLRSHRRAVAHRPDSLEAIRLASITFGVSYRLLERRASCETGGSFNRYSQNPSSSASGLFQFLDSTWASTPYRHESVWSPYANALAAAWMEKQRRGGEWVCQ